MPLISIVVPNYNHARFLPRRIESILAQTVEDYELIILDDASTDDSVDIIRRYIGDRRIRFYPQNQNSGSTFIQWNRGVSLAKGEFVWLAESDDFSAPTQLETLIGLLSADPRLALAYCQSNAVDATDRVFGSMHGWTVDLDSRHWERPYINDGRNECSRYLLWKCTVPNASAVLFRRETYIRAGGAPTHLRLCGDWLTWARMLIVGDIAFTPDALNFFRSHDTSQRSLTSRRSFLQESWAVQRFILSNCSVKRSEKRRLAWQTFDLIQRRMADRPRSGRWDEFKACVSGSWPILSRAPETTAKLMIRAGMESLGSSNRMSFRVGRLFYVMVHRPLAEWKKDESRMARAARRLTPVPLPFLAADWPTCRFLTGDQFWYQTAFCARSLEIACGSALKFEFYDDGSLRSSQCSALRRCFPGSRIIPAVESTETVISALPPAQYPLLHAARVAHPLMRKLLDLHTPRSSPSLCLDSDMLFFEPATELGIWLRRPDHRLFLHDVLESYVMPRHELERRVGQPLLPAVNTGIVAQDDESLDWAFLEWFIGRLEPEQRGHRLLEQTLIAAHFARVGASPLPPEKYRVLVGPFSDAPSGALLHYCWNANPIYRQREWRRFLAGPYSAIQHGTFHHTSTSK